MELYFSFFIAFLRRILYHIFWKVSEMMGTITIIKKGKVIQKRGISFQLLLWFLKWTNHHLAINKEIYKDEFEKKSFRFTIGKDVEYIEFQQCYFDKNVTYIVEDPNTEIRFFNCIFSKKATTSLTIQGGDIHFENYSMKEDSFPNNFYGKNLNYFLMIDLMKNDDTLKKNFVVEAQQIDIAAPINARKTNLVATKRLRLKNVNLKDEPLSSIEIDTNELEIYASELITHRINLNFQQLKIHNVTMEATDYIKCNDVIYYDYKDCITSLRDEDLYDQKRIATASFISTLKNYKEYILTLNQEQRTFNEVDQRKIKTREKDK